MSSKSSEGIDDLVVRMLVHRALACGLPPPGTSMVGPVTRAAITAVARHRPDATADHIVAVYDAHTLEKQRGTQAGARRHQFGDKRSAHAIDYAATDTLIAQLTITYPRIPRHTIAGVVRELRTTLADPHLHALALLRIEYEAHQRLCAAG